MGRVDTRRDIELPELFDELEQLASDSVVSAATAAAVTRERRVRGVGFIGSSWL